MDITEKLVLQQAASCNCLTKTPDTEFHKEYCLYKVLVEAVNEIEYLRNKLEPYLDPKNWDKEATLVSGENNINVVFIPAWRANVNGWEE